MITRVARSRRGLPVAAVADRLSRPGPLEPRWPSAEEWRDELYEPGIAEIVGALLRWSEGPPRSDIRQRLARYDAEAREFAQARAEWIWQAPD
jgi:hypothetical protein